MKNSDKVESSWRLPKDSYHKYFLLRDLVMTTQEVKICIFADSVCFKRVHYEYKPLVNIKFNFLSLYLVFLF